MTIRPRSQLFAFLLSSLITLSVITAGPAAAAAPDRIDHMRDLDPSERVLVINDEKLEWGQLSRFLTRMVGRTAIDSFLEQVLIRQAARKHDLEATEEEIDSRRERELRLRMQDIHNRMRLGAEQFQRIAREQGWDVQSIRSEVKRTIRRDEVESQVLIEKILRPQMDISEEELRRYYAWTRGERFSMAHIIVPSTEEARQVARFLREQPDAWAQVATDFSRDPYSAPQGGRLIPVPASSGYGRVLAEMEDGDIKLHQAEDRWHIIRRLGRVEPQASDFDDVREELKRELEARRAKSRADFLVADLWEDATIVTNVGDDPEERSILGRNVVAYVNGKQVSTGDFAAAVLDRFGHRAIDPFIEYVLVQQEASRQNISVSRQDIQRRRRQMARRFKQEANGPSAPAADRAEIDSAKGAGEAGDDGEFYAPELFPHDAIVTLLLAEKMVDPAREVTEDDIRRAYNRQYGLNIAVRRLVTDDRDEAMALRRRAMEGANFDALARTLSREPLSWTGDAAITEITRDHELYDHVSDLEPGEVSDVVERDDQFILFQVIDRSEADTEAPKLEAVKTQMHEDARRELQRRRIQAWLQKLRAEAGIREP
ncbi:MAG: peptidyl-prolyl cis-trans isomerase [Planctomycetota bacterium]